MATGLAGPAGGPVTAVWFSESGDRLYARTGRGLTYVTNDYETWAAAPQTERRPEPLPERADGPLPERVTALRAAGARKLYAFGAQVYSLENGGKSWVNLTAFAGRSIIGENPHDLAVSPGDAELIAVANDAGVWCSHDGGLSWTGLNSGLPNLPVKALLPEGGIAVEGIGDAILQGSAGWVGVTAHEPDFGRLSAKLGAAITASIGAGDIWYAGAQDGRIWTSSDAQAHWALASVQAAGPIERFVVDPDAPRIAFAAASGRGPHLLRTVNGGQTWYDVSANLTGAHGVAIEKGAGAVYVATDTGVFLSRMDLNVLGTASPWASVSDGLPVSAPVVDVRLEGSRLLAAVDGWGVYGTRAPHEINQVRLVNAADLSTRAVAPGGLVSAIGITVNSASALGRDLPVLEHSQIQIPFGTEPSEMQVDVNRSLRLALTVKAVAPAMFVDPYGAPLVLDAETGLMLDSSAAVQARSTVQVLATGFGKVSPDWPSGMPAPEIGTPVVASQVRAFLNGREIEVVKATLAPGYIGMYLVEIRIPSLLDEGMAELYLEAGGEKSNTVRLKVAY